MDILNESELTLRHTGFHTARWSGGRVPVMAFENWSVIGFLHLFENPESLVGNWEDAQRLTLSRFSSAIKLSGAKAWNVYSIFVAEPESPLLVKRLERIEEDFSLTRKIARIGVKTPIDIQNLLLPLLPVASQPALESADFAKRLRDRLIMIPETAVSAFIGDANARDVAEMLRESP